VNFNAGVIYVHQVDKQREREREREGRGRRE